ncbi:accessory gland protein Acp63F-like [Drosophila biarmipes]|uniref:accessory gland protein Acp63F-like n=1 Tax=Drosophila biarmipes TaxID=125945 RepID=UPI0007E5DC48|nr:accessory gland protein Acp63F-like [Drosophila biarmipes]
MKNFGIVLILVFLVLEIQGKCDLPIPEYIHPLCGIARECVFDGGNIEDIKNESCRRREQGKAPFLRIENGYCEEEHTQCPRSN